MAESVQEVPPVRLVRFSPNNSCVLLLMSTRSSPDCGANEEFVFTKSCANFGRVQLPCELPTFVRDRKMSTNARVFLSQDVQLPQYSIDYSDKGRQANPKCQNY